ncbi:monovalent cation/H(+) antiporter subunit G [Methylobacterium sp. NFXW15]|uniref:monovalent cation/H(+) antiporter subunit G n=1 Tax=Methylobacterium sp. NFXW15 TaxID=2819512 RepID=UPI003CF15033
MTPANVPLWAAYLVVLLALAGAGLSLTGAFGLIRLKSFYERVHAPTLGATLGMALIMASSVLLLSMTEGHLVIQEMLIGVFLTVTTPVTLILLARAAAHRDRHENNPDAPPKM